MSVKIYLDLNTSSTRVRLTIQLIRFAVFSYNTLGNYLHTSGFWPRVRARALRAPVFLGSLPRPTGRAPRPSQLRCSPKI